MNQDDSLREQENQKPQDDGASQLWHSYQAKRTRTGVLSSLGLRFLALALIVLVAIGLWIVAGR